MSYNDLSSVKKIDGVPVDLDYFAKVTENDAFFKNVADTDEDLTLLDRDILPTSNNLYNLAQSGKSFLNGYISNLFSQALSLSAGTTVSPSLKIGTAGLASLNTNELSLILAGLEPLKVATSGVTLKAANNTVLKLQNTLPGSQALWSLGTDENGFSLIDSTITPVTRAVFGSSKISLFNNLNIINGTELLPALAFSTDPTTGMYKDPSGPLLYLGVSGSKKLSLSSAALEVLSDRLSLPVGSATTPSLTFTGNTSHGLSFVSNSIGIILSGQLVHSFSGLGYSAESNSGLSHTRTVYSDTAVVLDDIRKANGTKSIPTAVANNNDLYIQRVSAYTGSSYSTVAEVGAFSIEDFSAGTYGTGLSFSTVSLGDTNLTEKLLIGQIDVPSVHFPRSLGIARTLINTAGLGQEINIRGISKLAIDATSGNIEIKGFTGGKEGQMLYIYKKVPTNSFTLVFNSGTATQKILLKGSTNFVNTNDYGGITLSFDDGVWHEVSRS